MRCPDCNKFVSYDEPDVEVSNLEADEDFVRLDIRVSLRCAECGTDLKEADIEVVADYDGPEHEKNDCDVTAEETDCEPDVKVVGSGRYAKTFYGARVGVRVTCACGALDQSLDVYGHEQASAMEEMV